MIANCNLRCTRFASIGHGQRDLRINLSVGGTQVSPEKPVDGLRLVNVNGTAAKVATGPS